MVCAIGVACAFGAALARLPVIPDEAYYWTWGRAPALHYLDHPPGVAWVLAASAAVWGEGLLGLRIPTLLAMVTTALASVLTARRLAAESRRKEAGELAALLLFGAPMFAVGYLPATPDPFQGAAISLSAYLVIRAFEDGAPPAWSAFAAFSLIAPILMKHSTALIAFGALLGFVSLGAAKRSTRHVPIVIGSLAGALVLAPWLLSEAGSTDGSIAFQFSHPLVHGASRGLLAGPLMLGSMMGTLGPMSAPFLVAFVVESLRRHPTKQGPDALHILGAGALCLLLACFVVVVRGGGEANWPMPAFIFALPGLVLFLLERPRLLRIARVGGAISSLLSFFYLLHIAQPFLPIPARRDPMARGAGLEEVARAVERLAVAHSATTILARRYQSASLLRFHLEDRLHVIELGVDRRSQYDSWPRPKLSAGQVAILAQLDPDLPGGLPVVSVPGASTTTIARLRGAEVIETYFLTPVLALRSLDQNGTDRAGQ